MLEIDLRAVRIETSCADEKGYLAFDVDDRLLAVLVYLEDAIHGELAGSWFLKACFGQNTTKPSDTLFNSVDEAVSWLEGRLHPRPH